MGLAHSVLLQAFEFRSILGEKLSCKIFNLKIKNSTGWENGGFNDRFMSRGSCGAACKNKMYFATKLSKQCIFWLMIYSAFSEGETTLCLPPLLKTKILNLLQHEMQNIS